MMQPASGCRNLHAVITIHTAAIRYSAQHARSLSRGQLAERFCFSPTIVWLVLSGLKGSMRVRGPVPSQSMHLAKAVQDGMRRAMRRPSVGQEADADGGPTEPGTVQGGVLNFQSDPLPAEPVVEDRVKVSDLSAVIWYVSHEALGEVPVQTDDLFEGQGSRIQRSLAGAGQHCAAGDGGHPGAGPP